VIAFVGVQGFSALAALLGAAGIVFALRRRRPSLGISVLLALLLWALASVAWSPSTPLHLNFQIYRQVEAFTAAKLVLELALYTALIRAFDQIEDQTASYASLGLALGLTLLALLVGVEFLDGAGLYDWVKALNHQSFTPDIAKRNVARGCYVVAVLFWPATLRLRAAGLPAAILVLTLGFVVSAVCFSVDAPILAFALSSLVYGLVILFRRRAVFAAGVLAVVYFGVAPLLAQAAAGVFGRSGTGAAAIGKASWGARVDIWRFASERIREKPFTGWGLEASRSWPDRIPMHPHDAALQIWLELGAVGVALAALFWAWLFSRIAAKTAQDPALGAAAAAAATAYLVIGALSFGVWQEWWLGFGALSVVFVRFTEGARRQDAAEAERHWSSPVAELTPLR
jgi:O-antigen ligase